jgi:hypothetical protein
MRGWMSERADEGGEERVERLERGGGWRRAERRGWRGEGGEERADERERRGWRGGRKRGREA